MLLILIICATLSLTSDAAFTYNVSKTGGLGRKFDGIGGLSAGASSRLLADYDDEHYGQIMDYMFLPGFGASLHILKVEIGGDSQSTDGTEASHMHTADDENYQRGYEWRLMVEAKKRNPNVILYALSWAFPGWVGEDKGNPWTNSTVRYTVNWLLGAKKYYNLDIDYISIWNERAWDKWYTLTLKSAIVAAGLKTKILGHDAWWDFCESLAKDPEWASAVDLIGAHYPGASIPAACAALNKTQWSSEDFSLAYDTGSLCWARALNQDYVRANMTATIAWALINSYYDRLPYPKVGLMRAVEPWSGHFEIGRVLWVSAHWGQFTKAGWSFLQHGQGVGLLDNGGSYVSLTDPNGEQLTIIVETMKREDSLCAHSSSVPYNTTNQTATFQLDDSFAHVQQLYVFLTDLRTTDVSQSFVYQGAIQPNKGSFTLNLPVGILYTVSTINGTKGSYQSPASAPFPLPYADNFDGHQVSSEAPYFSDQSGSFEIVEAAGGHGKTMRQMVTEIPIRWCSEGKYPYSVLGDSNWKQPQSLNVTADILIENNGTAFVAIGIAQGGCISASSATVLSVNTHNGGSWQLAGNIDLSSTLASGLIEIKSATWYTLSLAVLNDHSDAYINGKKVGQCSLNATSSIGFVGIGSSWDFVQFDNFYLQLP